MLRLLSGMGQREIGPGITEGLSVALKNVESARALPGFKNTNTTVNSKR